MSDIKQHPSRAEFERNSKQVEDRLRGLEERVTALSAVAGKKAFLQTFGRMPDNETARGAERLGRAFRRRQPKC